MHGNAKQEGIDPIFGGSNRPEKRAASAPRWSKAKNEWVASPSKGPAPSAPASAGGQGYGNGSLFGSLGRNPNPGNDGSGTHRRMGTDLHTGAVVTQRGLWRSDSAPGGVGGGPSQFALHGQ